MPEPGRGLAKTEEGPAGLGYWVGFTPRRSAGNRNSGGGVEPRLSVRATMAATLLRRHQSVAAEGQFAMVLCANYKLLSIIYSLLVVSIGWCWGKLSTF